MKPRKKGGKKSLNLLKSMGYFTKMITAELIFRQTQDERKEMKANKQKDEKPKQREKKRLRRRVVALNQASSAISI